MKESGQPFGESIDTIAELLIGEWTPEHLEPRISKLYENFSSLPGDHKLKSLNSIWHMSQQEVAEIAAQEMLRARVAPGKPETK